MTLLGRDESWGAVQALLGDDAGGALLIVGEAGMGKTSLLAKARAAATASGHLVLHAGAGQYQAPGSLHGLGELLGPLRPRLRTLSPRHRSALDFALGAATVPAPSELTLSTAVLALLSDAATTAPAQLVVDDAQWWDSASCRVIGFVARRLTDSGVKLLAATRPGHAGALEQAGLPRHVLPPLDDETARRLLRATYPQLSSSERERVVAAAAGNPLALLELPRSARDRAGSSPLPEKVSALFGPRVSALPATARDTMLIAALEGTGDLALVTLAAGGTASEHLSVAERDGLLLIDETVGSVHFRHPLVPHTVVSLADDAGLRTAHSRLAAALADSPLRRTWHLAAATEHPDEPTAALVEEHAHLALHRGDAIAAAALLQRAAALSPNRARRAHRQLQAAFIGADVTGDLSGARELLADVDRLHPALTRSLPAAVAASFLLLNAECDVDTAHRVLADAVRTHPGRADADDPVLDAALHSLLMMCWFGGRRALWDDFLEATSRLGARVPPLLDVCHRTFGDPTHQGVGALDSLAALLRGLPAERDPVHITRLALACVYTDRLPGCRAALRRVIDDGRDGGAVALAINALVSSCVDAWLTGQWGEALELSAEGMDLCREHGYRRYSVILGGYIDQLVRVARGELDAGRDAAEEMVEWATSHGAGMAAVFAEHLYTLRAAALGDAESAYRHAARIAPPGELAAYHPHALWVLFDLVEAAVATGRLEEARAHVAAMRHQRLEQLSPRVRMVVQGCTALADRTDAAADAFLAALAVPGGPQWPFDRARIELAYGEHLRQRRLLDEARPHLTAASDSFHRLGARPWQARADAALRAAGVGGGAPARTRGPAATLSARERQIAELAAQGLTNRQIGERLFLSPRSVGATLYRLFPKLGISSRASLAAALEADP